MVRGKTKTSIVDSRSSSTKVAISSPRLVYLRVSPVTTPPTQRSLPLGPYPLAGPALPLSYPLVAPPLFEAPLFEAPLFEVPLLLAEPPSSRSSRIEQSVWRRRAASAPTSGWSLT